MVPRHYDLGGGGGDGGGRGRVACCCCRLRLLGGDCRLRGRPGVGHHGRPLLLLLLLPGEGGRHLGGRGGPGGCRRRRQERAAGSAGSARRGGGHRGRRGGRLRATHHRVRLLGPGDRGRGEARAAWDRFPAKEIEKLIVSVVFLQHPSECGKSHITVAVKPVN